MRSIAAPVGRDSENRAGDVMVIQQLLNYKVYDLGMQPLKRDGQPSEELNETIEAFQKKILRVRRPDGVVDPGRRTFKRLSRMTISQRANFDMDWIVPHAPKWIQVAASQMGVFQLKGTRKNDPTVLKYIATVPQLKTSTMEINGKEYICADVDENNWCGCFVNWCLLQSGYPGHDGILAARAKEWMSYGIPETGEPDYGSIVTLTRRNKEGKRLNHVGFYLGRRNGRIVVLGGNQENRVRVITKDQDYGGTPRGKVCVSEFSGWEDTNYRWPILANKDEE